MNFRKYEIEQDKAAWERGKKGEWNAGVRLSTLGTSNYKSGDKNPPKRDQKSLDIKLL